MPRDVPQRRKPAREATQSASGRALDDLLCRLSDAAEARPLPVAELRSALTQLGPARGDDLLPALETFLARPLPPVQAGRLTLASDVFRAFTGQPLFHPDLAGMLCRHSSGFLVAALDSPSWLLEKDHPLHALASMLAEQARGWYPEHVRAAEVADAMIDWLQGLTAGDSPQSVLERARGWQSQFAHRQQILTSRLIEAELGGLKLARVRERVAGSVSRLVAGRQLPDFIVRQLMDEWLPGLQWLLLQQGEQGPEWPEVTRLFGLLVWTLQPGLAQGPTAEKWQRVSAEVRQALPDVLPRFIRDEQSRNMIEEQVAMAHLALQGERELCYIDLPSLQGATLLDAVDARLSRDLMDEINNLSEQTWFRDASGGRFRLLLKDATYQQLVFVNQAGVKAFADSFDGFALKLSTGEVRALTGQDSLWTLLGARLQELRADAETLAAARQQQAERERARQQALADAERVEQAHQQEHARLEAAAASSQAQARQKLRLKITGLPLGSWLDFNGSTGKARLKLAVILPSSGKYVFVDSQGGNRQALSREELLEQLLSGDVSFVGEDLRFDDTLDRLVDGLAQ
jgi:hypothetical protein